MLKNDYRRALIMLRALAEGVSGYVRLERRTLIGTLQFTINGALIEVPLNIYPNVTAETMIKMVENGNALSMMTIRNFLMKKPVDWMAFLSARRISAIANRHWLSCNMGSPSTVSYHWQRRQIRLVKCCLLHRKRLSDCFVRLGLTGSHNTNTGGLN